MTPEEAKEKWCPMGGIGPHRQSDLPQHSACIADKCAAWRWSRSSYAQSRYTAEELPIDAILIHNLGISTMLKNCFKNKSISTVGEARRMTNEELLRIPCLGKGSLREFNSVIDGLMARIAPVSGAGFCGLAGRQE